MSQLDSLDISGRALSWGREVKTASCGAVGARTLGRESLALSMVCLKGLASRCLIAPRSSVSRVARDMLEKDRAWGEMWTGC